LFVGEGKLQKCENASISVQSKSVHVQQAAWEGKKKVYRKSGDEVVVVVLVQQISQLHKLS
jgi:hypothetical protein